MTRVAGGPIDEAWWTIATAPVPFGFAGDLVREQCPTAFGSSVRHSARHDQGGPRDHGVPHPVADRVDSRTLVDTAQLGVLGRTLRRQGPPRAPPGLARIGQADRGAPPQYRSV